jgi:CRISPR/Cas system-associated protein Cas10 (large subunit of type III CRISPR-Cas system)
MYEQALLGVPVYAGGDDPLAFVPASTALDAAQRCHNTVPQSLPSVSAAVLFFHDHASI